MPGRVLAGAEPTAGFVGTPDTLDAPDATDTPDSACPEPAGPRAAPPTGLRRCNGASADPADPADPSGGAGRSSAAAADATHRSGTTTGPVTAALCVASPDSCGCSGRPASSCSTTGGAADAAVAEGFGVPSAIADGFSRRSASSCSTTGGAADAAVAEGFGVPSAIADGSSRRSASSCSTTGAAGLGEGARTGAGAGAWAVVECAVPGIGPADTDELPAPSAAADRCSTTLRWTAAPSTAGAIGIADRPSSPGLEGTTPADRWIDAAEPMPLPAAAPAVDTESGPPRPNVGCSWPPTPGTSTDDGRPAGPAGGREAFVRPLDCAPASAGRS
ncbi:hypothetical protein [Kitasatospora sp. MAP5-34]|uniref:hypothetical protein n=1 Tax=Kitasatospora sp. MAP5-34 TaxID=3035102 RepID=UPI002473EDAB|nr:hypothetical protein [Kitasatospora sp. MAP5-34]